MADRSPNLHDNVTPSRVSTSENPVSAAARLSDFSLSADERADARDALRAAKAAEGAVTYDDRVSDLNEEAGR